MGQKHGKASWSKEMGNVRKVLDGYSLQTKYKITDQVLVSLLEDYVFVRGQDSGDFEMQPMKDLFYLPYILDLYSDVLGLIMSFWPSPVWFWMCSRIRRVAMNHLPGLKSTSTLVCIDNDVVPRGTPARLNASCWHIYIHCTARGINTGGLLQQALPIIHGSMDLRTIRISLSGHCISKTNAEKLLQILNENPLLERLSTWVLLLKLEYTRAILFLVLRCCALGSLQGPLFVTLGNLHRLHHLRQVVLIVQGNQLGCGSMYNLSQLAKCWAIQSLYLDVSGCDMDDEECISAIYTLTAPNLQNATLLMMRNNLTDTGMDHLARTMLQHRVGMEDQKVHLDVHQNRMGKYGLCICDQLQERICGLTMVFLPQSLPVWGIS